jgi:cellulose synthase/poly-beta-1,6-N-acetylglucosamine synthase-like glycosyltransferase
MSTAEFILIVQIVFFVYFVLLNGSYLILNLIAGTRMWRVTQEREAENAPRPYAALEPPISVLVPAFNEEKTIVATVRSLLLLNYPEYEIVVINDDSKDATLETLISEFGLAPFPETAPQVLEAKPVRTVYQSTTHPNLRVVDKENGGKADSLNAGINYARHPLFCCIDADSILQRDSLQHLVKPFLEDARTVATGGTVRVANGCVVRDGMLVQAGLPKNLLALLQIVEYLRAFLFGRLGWAPMNAMLIISGAMGLFDKAKVMKIGGYRSDTVGEDMELVVRLHAAMSDAGVPYRIHFVPDPICWTEVPEDLSTLKTQRVRWQRGLCESLMANRDLFLKLKGGAAAWVAYPFMLLFEMFGPILELLGYIFVIVLFILGLTSFSTMMVFLMMAFALGVLLSVTALVLEEMSYHIYPRPAHMLLMFGIAILDNFGYRQLNAAWRLIGLVKWMFGGRAKWGVMNRKASWNKTFMDRLRKRKGVTATR